MFISTVILFDSIYRKDENYYLRVFREILFYWRHETYYSNSDEEYYNEECINLFLETLKK